MIHQAKQWTVCPPLRWWGSALLAVTNQLCRCRRQLLPLCWPVGSTRQTAAYRQVRPEALAGSKLRPILCRQSQHSEPVAGITKLWLTRITGYSQFLSNIFCTNINNWAHNFDQNKQCSVSLHFRLLCHQSFFHNCHHDYHDTIMIIMIMIIIILLLSLLLSTSLYFSKRGAYWDRLCRDVVGWLSRACTVAKRCILGL